MDLLNRPYVNYAERPVQWELSSAWEERRVGHTSATAGRLKSPQHSDGETGCKRKTPLYSHAPSNNAPHRLFTQ